MITDAQITAAPNAVVVTTDAELDALLGLDADDDADLSAELAAAVDNWTEAGYRAGLAKRRYHAGRLGKAAYLSAVAAEIAAGKAMDAAQAALDAA
jgi:hypothetical protein